MWCFLKLTSTRYGRFLWWLECSANCSLLDKKLPLYDLLLADVDNNIFGVVLKDVGPFTKVGFMGEANG